MLEVKFEGKVMRENGFGGGLNNENSSLTSDFLFGIDELLELNNLDITEENDEIEIVVRIKNR